MSDGQTSTPRIDALRVIGAEFERLAAGEAGQRRLPGRAPILALAAVAVLAALMATTPTGRAIAEKIGDLVGIGDSATLPPQGGPGFLEPDRSSSIVLSSNLAPDGRPFEIVGYRARDRKRGSEYTCLAVDLLKTRRVANFQQCFPADNANPQRRAIEASGIVDRNSAYVGGAHGSQARYVLVAGLGPAVARAKVTYSDDAGTQKSAAAEVGQLTEPLRAKLESKVRAGLLVAFLPSDRLRPMGAADGGQGDRRYAGVLGTIHIAVFDADGKALQTEDLGKKLRSSYARLRRRESRQARLVHQFRGLRSKGELSAAFCVRAIAVPELRDPCIRILRRNSEANHEAPTVVAKGNAPTGQPFVILASHGLSGQVAPNGHPPTCLGLSFPEVPGPQSFSCLTRGARRQVHRDDVIPRVQIGPSLLSPSRLIVSGLTSPSVARVEVTYAGGTHTATLGRADRIGQFVAFLPSRLVPHAGIRINVRHPPPWFRGPQTLDRIKRSLSRVQIRAYAADGTLIHRGAPGQDDAGLIPELYPPAFPTPAG